MKAIFILVAIACFISCAKNKEDGNNSTSAKLTAYDLCWSNGKMWDISKAELTYYSASGSVDSTIDKPVNAYSNIWFGTPGTGGQYYLSDPLAGYLPGAGTWTLDEGQQKVSLSCISPYCSPFSTGTIKVTAYSPRNTYGEAIDAECEQSLPGGRKLRMKIRLYKP